MTILTRQLCLIFSLILFLSSPTHAGEKIDIAPDLRVGSTLVLKLTKSRENDIPNRAHRQGRSESDLRVRIVAASPEGFALDWRFLDINLIYPNLPKSGNAATLKKLLEITRDTRYLTRFDADGQFLELSNFDEVKPKLLRIFDLIGKLNTAPDETTLAKLRQMFSDKQMVEHLLVRDMLLYFNPMIWGEAEIGQAYPYDTMLPNPFGGEPLRAVGSLSYADAGKVKIVMEQKIDPAALPDMVTSLMAKVGQTLPEAEQEKMRKELSGFDIHDLAEYQTPAGKGWPDSVTHARTVSTSQGKEITRIQITKVAMEIPKGKRAKK